MLPRLAQDCVLRLSAHRLRVDFGGGELAVDVLSVEVFARGGDIAVSVDFKYGDEVMLDGGSNRDEVVGPFG